MYSRSHVTQQFRISSLFQLAIALLLLSSLLTLSACGGAVGQSTQSNSDTGSNSGGGGNNSTPAAVSVSVTGASSAAAGGTSTYTATVQNTSNTAVTWQVNGGSGNSSIGTITSAGVYTAPVLPPSGGTVTITAVSQADSTKSASTTVTIQYSNASIQGAYAFTLSGTKLGATYDSAGSFKADGQGNLSGAFDYLGTSSPVALTGTYTVGPSGLGSATFTSTQGSDVYHFMILQNGKLQLGGFDTTQIVTGYATQQDTSAFSLSALSGSWVFWSGAFGSGYAQAGEFVMNSTGLITSGEEDDQVNSVSYPAIPFQDSDGSSFAPGSSTAVNTTTGRGYITYQTPPGVTPGCPSGICFAIFPYYVVSATEVLGVGSVAFKQQGGPFSLSSVTGSYVFSLAGVDSVGRSGAFLGQFSANSCAQILGSADANDDGTVLLNQSFSAVCSSSVASNGRGTIAVDFTNGTLLHFVFYIVSPGMIEFVEADTNGTVSGSGIAPNGGPFSNASISGSFGLLGGGLGSTGSFDFVGPLKASGSLAGTLTGAEDVDVMGATQSGATLTGTYSVTNPASGRGTAAISANGSTSNIVFYVVSPGQAIFLDVDSTEVASGSINQQY